MSRFAETNVRTYVVDPDGHRSVWFDSLEATRLPVVTLARLGLGIPYVWSRMSIDVDGDVWTYETTRRRWPSRPEATSRVRVRVGERVEPDERDLFLTARWSAAAWRRGKLYREPVDHPAWRFRSAELLELDDELVAAAGYTITGEPVVRVAETLDARFGPSIRTA